MTDAGSDTTPQDVVAFWQQAGHDKWFEVDEAFDATFRARFLDAHLRAARRELDGWAETPEGILALILLLDQFPRNAFRGTAHMYATDPLARMFADKADRAGWHDRVPPELRVFLCLPFQHAEDPADQDRAVALIAGLGGEYPDYAEGHRDIIRRFGRFPHRNPMLGRATTVEEAAFLADGGFSG